MENNENANKGVAGALCALIAAGGIGIGKCCVTLKSCAKTGFNVVAKATLKTASKIPGVADDWFIRSGKIILTPPKTGLINFKYLNSNTGIILSHSKSPSYKIVSLFNYSQKNTDDIIRVLGSNSRKSIDDLVSFESTFGKKADDVFRSIGPDIGSSVDDIFGTIESISRNSVDKIFGAVESNPWNSANDIWGTVESVAGNSVDDFFRLSNFNWSDDGGNFCFSFKATYKFNKTNLFDSAKFKFGSNIDDIAFSLKENLGENNLFSMYMKKKMKTECKFFSNGIYRYPSKNSIRIVLKFKKKYSIPKKLSDLPDIPEFNDLYSLLAGRKLNKMQAKLLSNLTNRNFLASTNKYDSYLYIKYEKGFFTVNTTSSSRVYSPKKISRVLKSKSKANYKVVFDGEIDQRTAMLLSQSNVKFVINFNRMVKGVSDTPKKVKLIFVASKDRETMCNLFNISQKEVEKLAKTVKKIEKIPNSKIVSNKADLVSALNDAKNLEENPIVIFNNIDNRLFNEDLGSIGIEEAITCKSFKIVAAKESFQSTDFIFFDDVVNALQKVQSNELLLKDEFWSNFIAEYSNCMEFRRKITICALIIGGAGTSLVTSKCIHYYKNYRGSKK